MEDDNDQSIVELPILEKTVEVDDMPLEHRLHQLRTAVDEISTSLSTRPDDSEEDRILLDQIANGSVSIVVIPTHILAAMRRSYEADTILSEFFPNVDSED